MVEKILLIVFVGVFLSAFSLRNAIVMKRTGRPVRSGDRLVSLSIVLSACCFTAAILSCSDRLYPFMGKIAFVRNGVLSVAGFFLFATGIVLIWIVSGQLKDSWGVGVREDQNTMLVKSGVYAYVRNPYFLSLIHI